MEQRTVLGLVALIIVFIVGSFAVFTVNEKEKAIVLRLGKIARADIEPGLSFKIPVFETVRKFDARIQTLDSPPERYLTAEKKNVIVDAFVKWRVANVAAYFTSMSGDPTRANLRIEQVIKQELRNQFGRRSLQEVVSGERAQIMEILTTDTSQQMKDFGIDVVDVRIKRVDLPPDVSTSVYKRMEAERARIAKDFRSKGSEEAEKIRADADRKSTVILAEAYGEAERVRGEGDAKAADLYAKAYTQDPEFYSFYRSLLAYRKSFESSGNTLVLEPDSDFFRFFSESQGQR